MGVRIAGTGSYLPGPPIDQARLRELLRHQPDGLPESIQERLLEETGIETRHFAIDPTGERAAETNTSMATAAGRNALEAAGWAPDDVELLIVTTVIPDHLMPPTSTLVQESLGIARCAEMEISANCTAPFKALAVAEGLVRIGRYRRALVCASQFVSFLGFPPWSCPTAMGPDEGQLRWIVSDGAGAVALEEGEPDTDLRTWLDSVGPGKRSGMFLELGAAAPDIEAGFARGAQHVVQNIRYAMREGLPLATLALERLLRESGVDGRTVDHFIPSVSSTQVATRLARRARERSGVREEVWRTNFRRVGYLGGPGFFVVLDEIVRSGSVRPGDVICAIAEESSKWMVAGTVLRWNP